MSAAEALRVAREAGLELRIDGHDLVLQASAPPSDAVLDLLALHKKGVIALLQSADGDRSAEDWHAFHAERVAIAAIDGGQPQARSEAMAYESCVVAWLNRNPAPSNPDRCAWCGKPDLSGTTVLPFGADGTGHTWLHPVCWNAWHSERRAKARKFLENIGIRAPSGAVETLKLPDDFGKIGEA